MTHIFGSIIWTDAVFHSFSVEDSELILLLGDGSKRIMNHKNWEESFPITIENLKNLKDGDLIKFATWSDYDEKLWFCDIKLR